MRVAILGATSHIAKNLISFFLLNPQYELFLFARNKIAVQEFLITITTQTKPQILSFDIFTSENYDAVINCIGIADPLKQKTAGIEHFLLTERYDNLVLNYLTNHREAVYINFSSGAVYGSAFDDDATEESITSITVNNIEPVDYYRIAKLNSEAKHRALSDLKIIDLRIFSFFSRFIDLESGFLLCEMTRCLKEHRIFYTNDIDIVRDYVAPSDIFALIELCIIESKANLSCDVYSAKPVKKSELINLFASDFGLEINVDKKSHMSSTGSKLIYYSSNKTAERIFGYIPNSTSISSVKQEVSAIIK